jgi:DNA mismatch repair protein MutL
MSIQTLPRDVINLIAAGEVIDSLTAVVRELVENSLDSGANNLVISLYPDLWKVQVADNGEGMTLEDLKLCGLAHSTSKIQSREDLWKIKSLGFRGEALHSIAQVAELEIASRRIGELGWKALYSSRGQVEKIEPVAIAYGSIVTVSHLFANLPVRRRALPPWQQQSKEIQALIQDIALCHPQVTWQVWQDEQPWFNISPGEQAAQILPQLLKKVHFTDLGVVSQEVVSQGDNLSGKIELALGLPDRCHRHRPDWIKIAVNGRRVQLRSLEQTILNALARTLPRDRFPVCFVHLHTCPAQVDWNRHPAKAEIYLHSLDFWQEQLTEALGQALRLNSSILPESVHNQRVAQFLKASEGQINYTVQSPTTSALSLMPLTAVAQVHSTYIVAEHPSGLWLVEQHIAHERVLYEKLEDHWELVPLSQPILLNGLSEGQIEQLTGLGLAIEPFGEQLWAIRSAPALLAERDDCAEALLELSWGGNLQTAQVATACRSAIRNGTELSLAQMQSLLDEWKNTRHPRTCPHGRPIYLSLEETSLARFFRRHWVIGKSHGI